MKTLKNLGIALCLILVFAFPAFADCPPEGGIQSTPPCAVAQIVTDDPVAPNQATVPAQTVASADVSVSEVVLGIVENLLTVF